MAGDEGDELFERSMLWPETDGPYQITLRFDAVDGRAECTEVTISGRGGDNLTGPGVTTPLTAEAIRIPLRRLVLETLKRSERTATFLRENSEGLRPEIVAEASDLAEILRKNPSNPRSRLTDEHWQHVADVYSAAWRAGVAPTRAVQDQFVVSKSTAAKWVSRVRNDLGLLGPVDKGRAGGVALNEPEEDE